MGGSELRSALNLKWHNWHHMVPERLEVAILEAIARAKLDDWLPCSIGDLRNRLREIEPEAANASINSIAEAIISLAQEGALLVGKQEHGGKRLPFDFQKQLDSGYISNFFARDSFDLKLTHQGRKRIAREQENSLVGEPQDRSFAELAIEEARKSLPEDDGRPHPLVGAVVVKNGRLLATAHRGEAKGNHAEYIALEKRLADSAVAGATVYTTLEPCTTRNHPKIPCVQRLIERKVARVVIGMLDPDPRITGRGQRRLRSANIVTDFFPHDLMAEVEDLNREFTRTFESASESSGSPTQAIKSSTGEHGRAAISTPVRTRITSVSPIRAELRQTIVIEGEGFGPRPNTVLRYRRKGAVDTIGDSFKTSLSICNLGEGAHRWTAGRATETNMCDIAVQLQSWEENRIVLSGFWGPLGTGISNRYQLAVSDRLRIVVFGPANRCGPGNITECPDEVREGRVAVFETTVI
jgi:pyrimidine deaminase RibD-like protein